MTDKLYDIDSHLFKFTARVLSCTEFKNGYKVALDRTAFFPEAGGQPSDRGTLGSAEVLDVQISEDIIHYVNAPLEVGAEVEGSVNAERRIDFMQQHSAEHIISGLVHSLYGFENVGFHLSENTATLDFNGVLSAEQLAYIEQIANERIRADVKLKAYYPSEQELKKISYRSKKELEGAVRIVEIEDTDCCACCAPHVSSSAEIGVVHLENLGKMRGGSRLSFKAGGRAVADYRGLSEELRKIGVLLAARSGEEAAAVEHLLSMLELERRAAADAEKRLIEKTVLCAQNSGNAIFEELSGEGIFRLADQLYLKYGGLWAVFSPADNGFSFALRDDEAVLSEFFEDFKQSFEVRGGGRDGLRRGTVIADKDELNGFFENKAANHGS